MAISSRCSDEEFVRVTLGKKVNKTSENAGVNPIVLNLAINVDQLALTLETKPCFPFLNINVILKV